ncbi:hypothetical protein VSU01S_00070 [Vibrio superstes NBRC 103154]|uniref:Uncharacterized protein n=1 Tax=Vibrio superstes NBRC 103154 TaxID=1219062 RepID=A0A511QML3_9VIBR|nr:hypothetical protein VSU01S_00070 [Vibrio superstes NBRC 103154]
MQEHIIHGSVDSLLLPITVLSLLLSAGFLFTITLLVEVTLPKVRELFKNRAVKLFNLSFYNNRNNRV